MLADDLEELKATKSKSKKKMNKDWAPLLFSKDFFDGKEDLDLEEYALKDRQVRRIGAQATSTRQELLQRALRAEPQPRNTVDAAL